MKRNIYHRINGQVVVELEKGVWPWMKPCDAAHAAGTVSNPQHQGGQSCGDNDILTP